MKQEKQNQISSFDNEPFILNLEKLTPDCFENYFKQNNINYGVIDKVIHSQTFDLGSELLDTSGKIISLVIYKVLTEDPRTPNVLEFLGPPGSGKSTSVNTTIRLLHAINSSLPKDKQINFFLISGDAYGESINSVIKDAQKDRNKFLELLANNHPQGKKFFSIDELQQYQRAGISDNLPDHTISLDMQYENLAQDVAALLNSRIDRTLILVDRVGMADMETPTGMKISGRRYHTETLSASIKQKHRTFESIPDTNHTTVCFFRGSNCYMFDFIRDLQKQSLLPEETKIIAHFLGFKAPETESERKVISTGASWEEIMFAVYNQHVVTQLWDFLDTSNASEFMKARHERAKHLFPDHFFVPYLLLNPDENDNSDISELNQDITYLLNLEAPLVFEDKNQWFEKMVSEPPIWLQETLKQPSGLKNKRKRILEEINNYNINQLLHIQTDLIKQEIRRARTIKNIWKYDSSSYVRAESLLKTLAIGLWSRRTVRLNHADIVAFILSTPPVSVIDDVSVKVIIEDQGYNLVDLIKRFNQMKERFSQRENIDWSK